jgi:hypothetical protein
MVPRRVSSDSGHRPVLFVRWLVVGFAAVLWVVLVPLIELFREVFRSISTPRLWRSRGHAG